MGWRLFQSLEQRIKRLFGKHVDFINNVYLVPAVRRQIAQPLTQVTNLINATIGGAVNFHHIQGGPLGNVEAGGTGITGIRGRAALTVERLGQYPSHGGLSYAT